jgi:hypothetical protein
MEIIKSLKELNKAEFVQLDMSQKMYTVKGRPFPVELLKYSSFIVLILRIIKIVPFIGPKTRLMIDEIISFLNMYAGPDQIEIYKSQPKNRPFRENVDLI